MANGMDEKRVVDFAKKVREINKRGDLGIRVFSGLECDIRRNGGDQTVALGPGNNLTQKVFSNYVKAPLGTRPAYPGKKPPDKPSATCYKQPLPDVNGAATGPADGSGR